MGLQEVATWSYHCGLLGSCCLGSGMVWSPSPCRWHLHLSRAPPAGDPLWHKAWNLPWISPQQVLKDSIS